MKEPKSIPPKGTKLIVTKLNSVIGLLIDPRHLDARREGETVTMEGNVPGHGGDVWWCKHSDGQIAAYSWTELEFVDDPETQKSEEDIIRCGACKFEGKITQDNRGFRKLLTKEFGIIKECQNQRPMTSVYEQIEILMCPQCRMLLGRVWQASSLSFGDKRLVK